MTPENNQRVDGRGQPADSPGRAGGQTTPQKPTGRRLAVMRWRLGLQPVLCAACGWGGNRSCCDERPARGPVDAYALPGAAWRGELAEVCPSCGEAAIEEAARCPACGGWGCLCDRAGQA